jgi:signal transduction histidine kinase/DNA-binding NarL/FixJ family response regulator
MPIGFTLHLFIQTAIHSLNYMRSTDARRRLTRRLKAQREDLKSIVERRTRKLSEANRRLMKINEDKTVFFTTVSHELRTPLTNIRLAIESLKGLKRGQDGANTLELLDRQSSRLSALVEGVLAFARLELNRLSPILRRENLEARVGFAVASSRSLAEDKGFKIRFQRMAGYTGPIESMVDPVLFDAALNNALDNAIRHSPPGGTVTVTVGLDSGQAAIWIDDSGPGIPESELKRIFDRFYSSDPSGTGIGLTLAKGIVEAMGGSMEAANRAEGGARFAICLPLCPAPAVEAESRGEATGLAEAGNAEDSLTLSADGPSAPAATSKPKARTAGTEPAGDRRRSVLVVEDDKDLLDFLIDGLSPSFRVVSASDGLEALERLRSRNDIAVIVSDVMMPRMDGRELFKRVQDDGGRPVPFIFLTAKALEEDRVQALHDGAVGYLTKPFSMEELEAKIGGMIEFSERQKDFFKQSIIAHLDSWSGTGIRAASEEKPAERPAKRSVREAAHAMGLTERQVDILSLLVKGYTDSEIATYCSISTKTVSDHVRNILEKANVDNRTQLAYELLSPGDVDV